MLIENYQIDKIKIHKFWFFKRMLNDMVKIFVSYVQTKNLVSFIFKKFSVSCELNAGFMS